MAAILVSFGFTFLIDRMTEVLTPDIYIELTGVMQHTKDSLHNNLPHHSLRRILSELFRSIRVSTA